MEKPAVTNQPKFPKSRPNLGTGRRQNAKRAAYLQQKNPAAAEFLRNTGEAASELLHPKTENARDTKRTRTLSEPNRYLYPARRQHTAHPRTRA